MSGSATILNQYTNVPTCTARIALQPNSDALWSHPFSVTHPQHSPFNRNDPKGCQQHHSKAENARCPQNTKSEGRETHHRPYSGPLLSYLPLPSSATVRNDSHSVEKRSHRHEWQSPGFHFWSFSLSRNFHFWSFSSIHWWI